MNSLVPANAKVNRQMYCKSINNVYGMYANEVLNMQASVFKNVTQKIFGWLPLPRKSKISLSTHIPSNINTCGIVVPRQLQTSTYSKITVTINTTSWFLRRVLGVALAHSGMHKASAEPVPQQALFRGWVSGLGNVECTQQMSLPPTLWAVSPCLLLWDKSYRTPIVNPWRLLIHYFLPTIHRTHTLLWVLAGGCLSVWIGFQSPNRASVTFPRSGCWFKQRERLGLLGASQRVSGV